MTDTTANKNLANLIIAGVNKAGSTSLYHYLSSHPDVCGSADKETCYFLPLLYDGTVPPLSEYESQFKNCGEAGYRMEATPAYIYGGRKIAETIKNTLGDIRILVILKDPVDRLISFYQRKKTTLKLPESLELDDYVKMCLSKSEDELALLENQLYTGVILGEYDRYIEPWLEIFGKNIRVLFFDDLKKDSRVFMKSIANWLNIDEGFYDTYDFDIKNKSHNYKNRLIHKIAVTANNSGQRFWRSNPGIKKAVLSTYYKFNGTPFDKSERHRETTEFLRNHFEPHNQRLKTILQRYEITGFPSWMEQEKVTA